MCFICVASSFRKILRLVKHTLASVSGVRDQEMALLDEMLAACAREASNKSLELIFSSHLFYQNRQEKFISSLAGSLGSEFTDQLSPVEPLKCRDRVAVSQFVFFMVKGHM